MENGCWLFSLCIYSLFAAAEAAAAEGKRDKKRGGNPAWRRKKYLSQKNLFAKRTLTSRMICCFSLNQFACPKKEDETISQIEYGLELWAQKVRLSHCAKATVFINFLSKMILPARNSFLFFLNCPSDLRPHLYLHQYQSQLRTSITYVK